MSVIAVENLGKKYTIGHQKGTRYQTLRDTLAHTGRGVWQRLRHPLSPNREIVDLEEIWALRDVNFEIKQGERVGIIGRNGAGKSTLLKILSRITHPTTGRVTITGRVASLLEVGTGFHPELTGRENIYLNGAILGMTRQEIKSNFDEIVAFAEVEKFLDTPVKHYSSGMYVRLAFAVAAHLEPEILLVDEVLAVGDAQFQEKCLGKMEDVTREGRTILFVSHNMGAITRLCQRCIWFEAANKQDDGDVRKVIDCYLSSKKNNQPHILFDKVAHKVMQIREIKILDQEQKIISEFHANEPIEIFIRVEANQIIHSVYFGIILQNAEGINILFADSRDVDNGFPTTFSMGYYDLSLSIPPIFSTGTYFLTVGIAQSIQHQSLDYHESACCFHWTDVKTLRPEGRAGILNLNIPWKIISAKPI